METSFYTHAKTNVVIHRSALNRYSQAITFRSEKAKQVYGVIDQLLASNPHCVDWDDKPPGDVADLFHPGDSVVLYGCYLGMCLSVAAGALENKGVAVSFSSDDCF